MVNTNRILKGNSGDVWLNGQLLGTLKTIKASIKGDFESDNFIGDNANYSIYNGWTGDGSLTLEKIDSTLWKLCADAYKSGVMPDIKIITALTDASSGKSERASIENITFTGFDLVNIEAKKIISEDFAFTFSNYEVLETI